MTGQDATTTDSSTISPGKVAALALAGTTIVGTLALTVPFVWQYVKSPLPYMATPKHKVQKALQFLATRTPPNRDKSQRVFVDLGSGDGEAVYQALQTGHYTRAIGVELNFTLWCLAQFRRCVTWTRHPRGASQFLWQDLFLFPLHNADTVMMFGVQPLMPQLSRKCAMECSKGTYLMSYRFPLPLATAPPAAEEGASTNNTGTNIHINRDDNGSEEEEEDLLLVQAKLIYDEEEMRIYECMASPTSKEEETEAI